MILTRSPLIAADAFIHFKISHHFDQIGVNPYFTVFVYDDCKFFHSVLIINCSVRLSCLHVAQSAVAEFLWICMYVLGMSDGFTIGVA